MRIELNSDALSAVSELCQEDALEVNISLVEESIDLILRDDCMLESDEQRIDMIRAYRRLGKQFQTILENVKEG